MALDLLETRPPDVSDGLAADAARRLYGREGRLTPLEGERDRTFRLDAAEGALVLKIGNAADPPAAVEMQVLALEYALTSDPTLPVPRAVRTLDGQAIGEIELDGARLGVQLVSYLEGRPPSPGSSTPPTRRAVGAVTARLDRALTGFDHPLARRELLWDLARLAELRPKLGFVAPDSRGLVERCLARFEQELAPLLPRLRSGAIHGDLNPANILLDNADPERIAGIVDFGDMVRSPLACDLAIAAVYQAFGADDPVEALVEVVAAYHAVLPLDRAEAELVPALAAARLAQSLLISSWRVELHPDNAAYILADADDSHATLARLSERDPAAQTRAVLAACGLEGAVSLSFDDSLALRQARLAPSLSLSYADPVRLSSGEGVWLTDVEGNRLLDAYNNVPQVGHAHPRVTNALAGQARRLATNTRYLVDEVTVYADRLARLLPGDLSVVLFVNSGSEANDLALQIARAVTGRSGAVITEHAYTGATVSTAALSPEEFEGAPLESWVATVGGAATLGEPDAAQRVGEELDAAFTRLDEVGHAPAMVIFDTVFSSDGIFDVPDGYLETAYARARAAGALCVADEVQAGFARVGTPYWGFASDGVVPDVVTLGKPMGNGHPIGAVVTTPEIAAVFARRWHFFSTFAGSPVAAAAGSAVLDVIEGERLAERAETVGAYLRGRLADLAGAHDAIVDVRGPGLFIGVELARADTAREVVDRMREGGVLIGLTGPGHNVLKIRPPLVFAEHHADRLVETLAHVLELVDQPPRP